MIVEKADHIKIKVKTEAKYTWVYKIGDELIQLPGFLLPIDLTPHKKTVCPVCGEMELSEKECCHVCGTAFVPKKTDLK